MPQPDPILSREIPVIRKIIADETWYEGERRGGPVSPDDPVVQERVCEIILRIGRELRESLTAQLSIHPGPDPLHDHGPGDRAAA